MNSLDGFSRLLLDKYKDTPEVSPEVIAREWIEHSGLSALPSLSEIRRQLESYGLAVRGANIPGLRGHHYCYRGGDHTVLYESDEWRGSVEFTLLHEFYEIVLDSLDSLRHRSGTRSGAEACWKANKFAAAVLMQKDIFLRALYESNFDIVWLHRHFYRSYLAVAIRALELLDGLRYPARRELACVIYQRTGDPRRWDAGAQDFHVGFTACTSGLRVGKHGRPVSVLPRRGDGVLTGSIMELALKTGRPVLLKRAVGSDVAAGEELTFLARPVYWFKRPAKVILEGMMLEDGHILEAQARPLHPKVLDEAVGFAQGRYA